MPAPTFQTPPPEIPGDAHLVISFPTPHIIHVALNRPDKFNALTALDNHTMSAIWDWYEREPDLRCAILGTTNPRAWCAGGDLKELSLKTEGEDAYHWPATGLGGIGRRRTKKPVIAAVRGWVIGGAVEMLTNLDVVIAGASSTLSLPEAKRGVATAGGGLPRFVYLMGRQKASELLMTGRDIPALEAERIGLVNQVVPDDQVEARALEIAEQTAGNSPDAVQLVLFGMRMAEEEMGDKRMMDRYTSSREIQLVKDGPNLKEGLRAFLEKRPPRWVGSKL